MIIHYMSASRIKKYLQCTKAYYETYENGMKSDATHLKFGTIVHRVFERWFQEDKDIVEIYEEEWRNGDIYDFEYYKDGLEIVQNFAQDVDKNKICAIGFEYPFAIDLSTDTVLDVSGINFNNPDEVREFLKELEEDDKPYIFGFIDRIDYDADNDILHINDYKTSRIPLTQEEADKDEQLSMYALVARYVFPEYKNVQLHLHYVRMRAFVTSTRTDEELDAFKNWLIHMYHKIKNDDAPVEKLNQYCGWCDARHGCVAYQKLVKTISDYKDINEIPFDELYDELETINMHIKLLQQRKDEIENIFVYYFQETQEEALRIGDKEVYIQASPRVKYDVDTVISLFPEKYHQFLSVRKTEVDKMARGDEQLEQMLRQTATTYFTKPSLRKRKARD